MNAVTLLVFARCIGFASRAPGFSHPSVPAPLRAGLAFVLALAIADGVHATARPDGIALVLALVVEVLLGSAIGTAASLVYDGAYAGGRAVDDYVGVKAIAPSVQLVAPSGFGRVWSLAFTGGFFLLGAYRITVLAFAESFTRVPPGAPFDAHAWYAYVLNLATTTVGVGVAVAAPAIALSFVIQIALGALSRAVPRFGSVTLAYPLVFGGALIVTALTIPLIVVRAAHPVILIPGATAP